MNSRLIQEIIIERSKKSISKSALSVIDQMQREIERLEKENQILQKEYPKSMVEIDNYPNESIYLPDEKTIRFSFSKNAYRKELYVEIRKCGDHIQVMGARQLKIMPKVSNVVEIGIDK